MTSICGKNKASEKAMFTATYLVFRDGAADIDTTVGPYENIETLKDQTVDVLDKLLSLCGASDGEYLVDATIEKNNKWYDSNNFTAVYKNGEVVSINK